MVSEKLLNELFQIIREDFGKELTQRELSDTANTLVEFFKLLFQIQTETERSKTNPLKVGSKKERIGSG